MIFTLTEQKMNGKKLNLQMKRAAHKPKQTATPEIQQLVTRVTVITIRMKHDRNQVFMLKKITIIIIRVMTLNSYSKTALIER